MGAVGNGEGLDSSDGSLYTVQISKKIISCVFPKRYRLGVRKRISSAKWTKLFEINENKLRKRVKPT